MVGVRSAWRLSSVMLSGWLLHIPRSIRVAQSRGGGINPPSHSHRPPPTLTEIFFTDKYLLLTAKWAQAGVRRKNCVVCLYDCHVINSRIGLEYSSQLEQIVARNLGKTLCLEHSYADHFLLCPPRNSVLRCQ